MKESISKNIPRRQLTDEPVQIPADLSYIQVDAFSPTMQGRAAVTIDLYTGGTRLSY
jgi:hypothetical protein